MSKTTIILFGAFLLIGSAHGQNLYKWVDEQGNVFYQDQPPEGAGESVEAYGEDPELIADADKDPRTIAAENFPITFFSIPICDACDLVRNMLQKADVPFTEKDVNDNPPVQDELMSLAGQLSVPALAVGKKVIYGYNSMAIEEELTSAGYFAKAEREQSDDSVGQNTGLSPEEVEQQAASAGQDFASELEALEDDEFDDLDTLEEIPEDEQIKVGTY